MGLHNSAYQFILSELESRQHFEPKISLAYGQKYNVPVHLVDGKIVLDEILLRHRFLPRGNVESMNRFSNNEMLLQETEETYADFSGLFNGSIENSLSHEYMITASSNKEAFIGRDLYAEKKIRALVKEDMKLVVVYGIAHCLHDRNRNSLFSRLQDFSPTREVLKWYEDK